MAEQHLGIPALLEPRDVVSFHHPDKLSILTYTAQFYHKFAKVSESWSGQRRDGEPFRMVRRSGGRGRPAGDGELSSV